MATYGDIVKSVIDITGRDDKEALIRNKINQIISFISRSGLFPRDFNEVSVGLSEGIDATTRVQSIPVDYLFRSLVYVRYPETVSKCKITIAEMLDTVRMRIEDLSNTAYVSGSNILINNAELSSSFLLGYYSVPKDFLTDGTEDGNTNWILTAVPGLVEDQVVAYVLNILGENQNSKMITQMAVGIFNPVYTRDLVKSAIM